MEISVELQRYMGSNGIRGEVKSQALQMMEDLLGAGFHTIGAFPMWLTCDSAKGERVFADCFFDTGTCRLLWKSIGSEETEKAVLDICSGLGIEGYFPFPYSD